jgi:uncharacterized protein YbaP (TraB family)
MLWKIEDTPHRILGSMHVLPKGMALPSWAERAYVGVERFVFEADHTDPSLQAVGRDEDGACWAPERAATAYKRAKRMLATAGWFEEFNGLKPWMAAFFIARRMLSRAGFVHENGIEAVLRAVAAADGFPVAYLECASRALDLVEASCESEMEGLSYFERVLERFSDGTALQKVQRMFEAWSKADMDGFSHVMEEEMHFYPSVYRPLFLQRNAEWAPVVAELGQSGRPTLFVVGAGHTVGPGSLIDQLQPLGLKCRIMLPEHA